MVTLNFATMKHSKKTSQNQQEDKSAAVAEIADCTLLLILLFRCLLFSHNLRYANYISYPQLPISYRTCVRKIVKAAWQ